MSIIPTTIDTETYTPKDDSMICGRPVIGWSGSLTTLKHLRTVISPLQQLGKFLDFRLKVLGNEDFPIAGIEVESKGWDRDSEVPDLHSFDIGIMPLPDDAWSRGKCGLKALQYMALGIPTVASPVGVNSEIIEEGKNGVLATSEQEWVEKLSLLLSDEALRERLSREGRKTVEEQYSAKVQALRLLDVFKYTQETNNASTSAWSLFRMTRQRG